MVLAAADVRPVPTVTPRKVNGEKIPGATAYPAIAVTTTKPETNR